MRLFFDSERRGIESVWQPEAAFTLRHFNARGGKTGPSAGLGFAPQIFYEMRIVIN